MLSWRQSRRQPSKGRWARNRPESEKRAANHEAGDRTKGTRAPTTANIFASLKNYRSLILVLVAMTIFGNSLNLVVPKLISYAIDSYVQQGLVLTRLIVEFSAVAFGIFVFCYLQSVAQTYASERVAQDLRTQIVAKIAPQDHAFIQQSTPAKLLTHLTSDVDAIKLFVAQAFASIISSICLILGASILLLSIDWELALVSLRCCRSWA